MSPHELPASSSTSIACLGAFIHRSRRRRENLDDGWQRRFAACRVGPNGLPEER
jgi:hypothetical protein